MELKVRAEAADVAKSQVHCLPRPLIWLLPMLHFMYKGGCEHTCAFEDYYFFFKRTSIGFLA